METIRHLPLPALRQFYAVAKYGSLAAAAERLFVTPGAISKQIRLLETALGLPLFVRQHRRLLPTPAGVRLLRSCETVFDELALCLQELGQPQRQDLVVSCEPTLAMKWLIPRLPLLQAACAGVNVVILAAGGAVDFKRQAIDVALRRNDFAWPAQVHAAKVADEYIAPVARLPLLQTADSSAACLHTHTRADAWAVWSRLSRQPLPAAPALYFEHFYLSLQAAAAGLGTAIGSVFMVQDDIRSGVLHRSGDFVADGSAYYLLAAEPWAPNTAAERFYHWLQHEMAQTLLLL